MAHAGARLLCELADGLGLADRACRRRWPRPSARRRGHDRGRVLTDLAVAVADGATAISDLRVLADQPELFGTVASVPTAWRALAAVDPAALTRIAAARAQARAAAWAAGLDPGFYVIDIDGVLVEAGSDKQHAAPTYKHGFGFYPLLAYLDATGEALAGLLRPGNAGSGTATDHLTVLDAALAQLPVDPAQDEVIVRTDAGGTSHELAAGCRQRQVRFLGGVPLRARVAEVILTVDDSRWQPTISADGTDWREGGEVAEITDQLGLDAWPPGTRMLVRREQPHPGAQLRFTDLDGYRYQVFVTDLPDPDPAYLEALYRGRGRVECRHPRRQRHRAGQPALPRLRDQHRLAHRADDRTDLLAWLKGLCLHGELPAPSPNGCATPCSTPPALLTRSARTTTLRIAAGWPWADHLVTAFARAPGWAPG